MVAMATKDLFGILFFFGTFMRYNFGEYSE